MLQPSLKCVTAVQSTKIDTHYNKAIHSTYNQFHCYCKRGYFRWGKISRKCWQDISRGGNFHDTAPISFIKAYGFNFRVGVIFAKKTKARKMRKLPPTPPPKNFHVYSASLCHYHYKNY